MEALSDHTTQETAYLVEDYPYSFRLRCKIRYWLEYKPGSGYRFWSQTTNPKKTGEVWNKPKASTYCRFGGVMLRDDTNGHIHWNGIGEYDDTQQCARFLESYGHTLPEDGRKVLASWVAKKRAYDAAKAEGHTMHDAAIIALQAKAEE